MGEEPINEGAPPAQCQGGRCEEGRSKEVARKVNEAAKAAEEESKRQVDKCVPIARELLKFVVNGDPMMGMQDQKQVDDAYDGVVKHCLEVLLREDVQVQDTNLVMQLMLQPIDAAITGLRKALQTSCNEANRKKWGKHPDELTMRDIDVVLKGK